MARIIKAPETMTGRERTIRTFQHEKTDRVTIGYDTNPTIDAKVKAALGVSTDEELRQALGVDYRQINARYIGPSLFTAPEGCIADPLEGCVMRKVENESGYYWDYCNFPLKDAEDEDFEKFPIPDPDDFDYDEVVDRIKAYGNEYGICIGGAGTPDIINSNGRIMSMEDVLCHLMLEDEAALDFIRRRADYQYEVFARTLDKAKGRVDFMWLGEDLGTQIAPMISMDLYRRFFKPIHKKFVDLAKAWNIPAMMHTCGSSSWAYEDFIDIGVTGVDTLQPEAANMSPEYLAEHFGGRLTFRGCISTAGPLAYGTPEEVTAVCKKTLETLMPYRGYHFAPTHCIQDNTPVENVIAMYQAAHDFGRYE